MGKRGNESNRLKVAAGEDLGDRLGDRGLLGDTEPLHHGSTSGAARSVRAERFVLAARVEGGTPPLAGSALEAIGARTRARASDLAATRGHEWLLLKDAKVY